MIDDEHLVPEMLPRIEAALASSGGGALLHGPPGCGKTRLAGTLSKRQLHPILWLSTPHRAFSRPGAAEAALRTELQAARARAPCVLVIDELHAVAPCDAPVGSTKSRLALQLADGIQSLVRASVFVLGICREPGEVHAAVRRNGRLHYEFGIRTPSPERRTRMLLLLAERLLPPESDESHLACELRAIVRRVARDAHGLCGAQLAGLCQHAAMAAWRRAGGTPTANAHATPPAALPSSEEWWASLLAARAAFMGALGLPTCPPSATGVSELGSAETAMAALERLPSGGALLATVIMPLRSPEVFVDLGVPPPRGVLLYGPEGCGKTTLARHVVAAAAANFFEVHAAQLISPVVGASERTLARLFASAQAAAPCILFIDGIESLAPVRGADTSTEGTMDRLLSLMLVELDGARRHSGPRFILLCATRERGAGVSFLLLAPLEVPLLSAPTHVHTLGRSARPSDPQTRKAGCARPCRRPGSRGT